VTLRGDTDFSHTQHLDRWDAQGTKFILGLDAHAKVVGLADALPAQAWTKLERLPKYEILTEPGQARPGQGGHRPGEGLPEPGAAGRGRRRNRVPPGGLPQSYRLVIVRKNLSVQRGEQVLFDEVGTSSISPTAGTWTVRVWWAGQRAVRPGECHRAAQARVNAMRMPVDDLVSNWAYMVMTALAWNLKAWFALLVPARERGWSS